MEEQKPQTLDKWRLDLRRLGRGHWRVFYEHFMGTPLSSPMRLGRALNLYGDWPVFEAIIDSSQRELSGDPLNYIVKVAHEKWKISQQQEDDDIYYADAIEQSKKASAKANKDLERRLKRKRK